MTRDNIYVGGELHLSLETVAELYEVQTVWLRKVIDTGLLGNAVNLGATISIAAVQMDRVATIVRLHEVLGLDLEAIVLTLPDA